MHESRNGYVLLTTRIGEIIFSFGFGVLPRDVPVAEVLPGALVLDGGAAAVLVRFNSKTILRRGGDCPCQEDPHLCGAEISQFLEIPALKDLKQRFTP